MKVLYDYQIFNMQKYGGISRYFYKLCKCNNGLWDYKVQANFLDNVYIEEISDNKRFLIEKPFAGKGIFIKTYNKINRYTTLLKKDYDIYHPTFYNFNKLNDSKPIVLTVHDFIDEAVRHDYVHRGQIINKVKAIHKADRIIAISHNTKNDLIKFYPDIPEDRIDVVYHAIEWIPDEKHELLLKIDKPYILFTGQRSSYKNFALFSKAVAPLIKKYDLYLVCTGLVLNKEEKQHLTDLNIMERTLAFFPEENQLKALYENALCFVFPSLYEGFGFPVLEAFASNCPIAVSDTSCFPEIAQDAALYFDPKSESDIRKKVEDLITSESLRNSLVKKGSDRIHFFTMENLIKNTYNVYKKAMER